MKALVVYESMFGNTREVAEAIAEGIASAPASVTVVNVNHVDAAEFAAADVVVIGGPTHAHGMSTEATRAEARSWAQNSNGSLILEPDVGGIGVREWLTGELNPDALYACFDTRADLVRPMSGAASVGIDRVVHHRGLRGLAPFESFFIAVDSRLEDNEQDRARRWGAHLGRTAATSLLASEV